MKKRILVISIGAEDDRRTWSGTVFRSVESARATGAEITFLHAQAENDIIGKLMSRYWLLLLRSGRRVCMGDTLYSLRHYRRILRNCDPDRYDLIFVPGYAVLVAALPPTTTPVVYLTDAPFSALVGYYPENTGLTPWNVRMGNIISRLAFKRSRRVIVSSEWARRMAVERYGTDNGKMRLAWFGANIESEDISHDPKNTERRIASTGEIRLLLSGVVWERKGGDEAVACCLALRRMGYDPVLDVAGMDIPQRHNGLGFIRSHGFLDKNDPGQYARYISLLRDADLLLFPSKAECSSIALCEAAAFGLPVVSYQTGGTPDYVEDGVNGRLLPLSATGTDFAEAIHSMVTGRTLDKMSAAARKLHKERLNWERWSEIFSEIINEPGMARRDYK